MLTRKEIQALRDEGYEIAGAGFLGDYDQTDEPADDNAEEEREYINSAGGIDNPIV